MPPEASMQRLPAGTPHVGQGTEDNCLGVISLIFIQIGCDEKHLNVCSQLHTHCSHISRRQDISEASYCSLRQRIPRRSHLNTKNACRRKVENRGKRATSPVCFFSDCGQQ
jgi:hypothetical protein